MHFQATLAVIAPLFAALATATPVPQGTAPGTVAVVGPIELPPNCYFPHGPDGHEVICTYTSDQPGAYPEVVSSVPDNCKPDEEDGADIVCYLPGSPDFGKRSVQDAYLFRFWCDRTGCHTSGLPTNSKRDAAQAIQEAYDFHIRIKWKRDLEDMMAKREANAAALSKQQAYSLSIRIKF